MSRLNKLIAFFILVVFAATAFLFVRINNQRKQTLETSLISKQRMEELEEAKKSKAKSDLLQVKLEKIENGQIEYQVVMDGAKMVKQEDRQTERKKLADGVGIYVACDALALEQWSREVAENGEEFLQNVNDGGEGQSSLAPREPDERCQGGIENLEPGSLVNLRLKEGEIIFISK